MSGHGPPHVFGRTKNQMPEMKTMKSPLTRPTLRGLVLALAVTALSSLVARAVPYATEVVKTGDTVTYILNQNAASVEVLRDGGNALYPGTTAGSYNFDMTGYTTFQIKVTGNDAPGWTQYIADGFDRSFYIPLGVSIDKNPASPNFGRAFISNAGSGTTVEGGFNRETPEGIYVLRADGVAADFGTGGIAWGGSLGPNKSSIGPDGKLYVADTSLDLCFELDPNDLSATGVQLIDASHKTDSQYVNSILVTGTQAARLIQEKQ